MILVLNKIYYILDYVFGNFFSLVVLYFYNNRIYFLGKKCFDGFYSLEILDLNYNNFDEFFIVIRIFFNFKELGFYSNNIRLIFEKVFVGNFFFIIIYFYDNFI